MPAGIATQIAFTLCAPAWARALNMAGHSLNTAGRADACDAALTHHFGKATQRPWYLPSWRVTPPLSRHRPRYASELQRMDSSKAS